MTHRIDRRVFITMSSLTAGLFALGIRLKAQDLSAPRKRKIKLGLVGCVRGSWIANLFQQHGGYEFHAVADYFQDRADKCGGDLGVDRSRRFSRL